MYTDADVTKDLVAKEVNEQLKNAGVLGEEDLKPQEPFIINLGGTEYKFNTKEEAQASLDAAFSKVAENQALLLQQIDEMNSNASKTAKANGEPEPNKFDSEKFINLMSTDPPAAFNYMDEFRFGADRIPPQIKEKLTRAETIEKNFTAYQFLGAHPEFQNTDENARKLHAIREQLRLPNDFIGLNHAYQFAQATGAFPTGEQQTQGRFARNEEPAPRSVNTPPPSPRRNFDLSATPETEAYVEGLTNEQLLALIQRG